MYMNNFQKFLKNPDVFQELRRLGVVNILSDRAFIRLFFKHRMGVWPNLENPVTFNEKLQWLKLHDRKPVYVTMSDKYAVREYIKEKLGDGYTIPLLGKWDRAEDIDFDKLPERFVLKCNHDSASVIVCKDKSTLDIKAARQKLNKCLKHKYFYNAREWPYKYVKPCIIAEEYMEDKTYGELRDYKFFCFNGVPAYMYVASDKNKSVEEIKFDWFDMDYNHLDLRKGHPQADVVPDKPVNFEEMKRLAAFLSKDIPHVRVDFFEVNGKIYFGEFTLYTTGGFTGFQPPEWDKTLGDLIDLSIVKE